jgi:hypothetical protein
VNVDSPLARLGLDPEQPYQPLNLAGADAAIPNPAQLAGVGEPRGSDMAADPSWVNHPTFTAPETDAPALHGAAGLADSAIEWYAPGQPDPSLPDLTQYAHPSDMDIYDDPLAAPGTDEPWLSDILWGTRAPELETELGATPLDVLDGTEPDVLEDKLLPPPLEPETGMMDRPGDLAPDALAALHDSPDYRDLPSGVTAANNYMLQPGATHRTRRETLQFLGLDAEER